MIVERKVELRVDEVVLRDRAFEVLVSYGMPQDQAHEVALAIARDVRKHATVLTTLMQTAENVNEPVKRGPYR